MRDAPGQFHKNLAKNLRKLRGDETQQAFAKRFGISHATINRIEQQKQNVTLAMLERFCRVLRCDPTDLLNGK
jgi:DNA-binding Xre family transcriptional regulator